MTIKRLMASLTTMFVTFFGVAISAVAIPAYAQAAVCGFEGLNTGGLGAGSGGYYGLFADEGVVVGGGVGASVRG